MMRSVCLRHQSIILHKIKGEYGAINCLHNIRNISIAEKVHAVFCGVCHMEEEN
jgi:hypothetical protein